MVESNLQSKVIVATKWSAITEIAAKLVSPITNMILARILTPDAFGIIATITMIISFIEIFTDSGFQKYLVQHEFRNMIDIYKSANVAFWTNLTLSLVLWVFIFFYRDHIANIVGSNGLGNVLAIASIQLPLTSFSSIQMALYKRDFDFKKLFLVRLVSVLIPFFITVPLAYMGFSYWSLIIGSISIQISNALILTLKSKWKPRLFFNFNILKKMFSFSIWSLIESLSIWLSIWVDTFVIASFLSPFLLGLYKTSTTMVNTLTALITGAIMPVLFSTLSRLQENDDQFKNVFLKFQRLCSILIFPLGVGVYLYSDLATQFLLGNQWMQASGVIGIWALTRSFKIIFADLCSEVYRAKGQPKLSFLAQILHLIFLIPTCIISAHFGFWELVYARSFVQFQFIIVHFFIIKLTINIPFYRMLNNVFPIFISSIIMGVFGLLIKNIFDDIMWILCSIIICTVVYFTILFLFPSIRKEILLIKEMLLIKGKH